MNRACAAAGIRLVLPAMQFCVDNAAMIALAGYLRHQRGERSDMKLNPRPSMAL